MAESLPVPAAASQLLWVGKSVLGACTSATPCLQLGEEPGPGGWVLLEKTGEGPYGEAPLRGPLPLSDLLI